LRSGTILAWYACHHSVPSGDRTNELWPTPKVVSVDVNSGSGYFRQAAGSRGSFPTSSSRPSLYDGSRALPQE
jgi:hypothetical protein